MSLKNDVYTYVYHDDNTKFNNKFYRDLKNCVLNEFFVILISDDEIERENATKKRQIVAESISVHPSTILLYLYG
jgi:hypothetical protein